MARLPTIGGDSGVWATVLNTYLGVAHTSGGQHAGSGLGVLIAPSDAPDAVKADAQVILTGSGDETAIQPYLDAGVPLLLGPGTIVVNRTLRVKKHGQTIVGAGTGTRAADSDSGGGTVIQPSASFDASTANGGSNYLLQLVDAAHTTGSLVPRARVLLRDFTVHGMSRSAATAGDEGTVISGIDFRGHRGLIDHVYVVSTTGDGIVFRGYSVTESGIAGTGWQTYDSMIRNCFVGFCGGHGYNWRNYSADMHIEHCIAASNGGDGFLVGGASHQYTGCHAYDNTGSGFNLVNNVQIKIANSKIEHNRINNLRIDNSQGTTISNCNFRGGTGVSQVKLTNGAFKTSIIGCWWHPTNGSTDVATYALDFDGDYWAVVAAGNVTGTYQSSGNKRVRFGATRANIMIIGLNGFDTQKSGTFSTGGTPTTSYTVSHGLSVTPAAKDITLTPQGDLGTNGSRWWISGISATQFVVNYPAAPNANVTVGWAVNSPS